MLFRTFRKVRKKLWSQEFFFANVWVFCFGKRSYSCDTFGCTLCHTYLLKIILNYWISRLKVHWVHNFFLDRALAPEGSGRAPPWYGLALLLRQPAASCPVSLPCRRYGWAGFLRWSTPARMQIVECILTNNCMFANSQSQASYHFLFITHDHAFKFNFIVLIYTFFFWNKAKYLPFHWLRRREFDRFC
jgi:hypothetical protein